MLCRRIITSCCFFSLMYENFALTIVTLDIIVHMHEGNVNEDT